MCISLFEHRKPASLKYLGPNPAIPFVFVTPLFVFQGGIKAVIWTDAFQFMILFGGIIVVIVGGVLEVGSLERVWEVAVKHGRAGSGINK